MSVFGDIVDGSQLEEAVIDMLQARYPAYLDEIAQQRQHLKGRAAYKAPAKKAYIVLREFDKWPENGLPCVVVLSPGMVDQPTRQGNGTYRATWYIGTSVIVSARTQTATRKLGMRYGAALRTCMLQNRALLGALNGKVRVTEWVSEDYDDLPPEDNKHLHAVSNIFHVEVDGVPGDGHGPIPDSTNPPLPPDDDGHTPDHGEWPTVDPDKLEIDVTNDYNPDE